MPNEFLLALKAVIPYTGISGISLLIFYFLLREFIRKQIFPQLEGEQSYKLIAWFLGLIFLLALSGILLGTSTELSPKYQMVVIILVLSFLLIVGSGLYKAIFREPQSKFIKAISNRKDHKDVLSPNEELKAEQILESGNGLYKFILQSDGNLVLYKDGEAQALWATETYGRNVKKCTMQEDGNLVLYGNDEAVIWASGTHNNPSAYLKIQNDGNVVIYKHPFLKEPLWATGTNG